jgi:hypothetical protein
VLSGRILIRMDDGSEEEFGRGDVMMLPPGHDAWTVGDEPCDFIEFSRGNDYYDALHGHSSRRRGGAPAEPCRPGRDPCRAGSALAGCRTLRRRSG